MKNFEKKSIQSSGRHSFAQPSLSRDFAFLSAAVLVILLLVSGWVTYATYNQHIQRVRQDLEKESARVDRAISMEMESIEYMLSSLGRQIAIDPNRDLTKLAQSLKSFDNKGHIYSIFTWTNNDHKMVVSSNKGVLDEPVDISDRDFIQQAATDSWKIHVGRPIEGRVSGRWVIPVGMGVTDYTGKFIGIISLSMDISKLTEQIRDMAKRDGISFSIISKTLIPITEASDDKKFVSDVLAKKLVDVDLTQNSSGFFADGSLLMGTGGSSYYSVMADYPYIVLMGYDSSYMDENVRLMLWSRLLQVLVVAMFFMVFLWIVRLRVIAPVVRVTNSIANIASGKKLQIIYKNGAIEISDLITQVKRVSDYIEENKKVESELRHKMFQLKNAKEKSDIALHSKAEFMIYMAQEIRKPLSNIIGLAQTIKDQMYGQIENNKYTNSAEDIFKTGNQLIAKMQDVLLHSKMDAGYISLQEKPVDVYEVVSSAIRQMADILQEKKVSVKNAENMQEIFPKILADEFRLQQIINNIILLIVENSAPETVIYIDGKIIGSKRDEQFFALTINNSEDKIYSDEVLLALAEQNLPNTEYNSLRLNLVAALAEIHNGSIYTDMIDGKLCGFVLFIPANRILFEGVS
jgi:signal transduction histidine kinase